MIDSPPPGFAGLSPDLPITTYKRNLPHWRQQGATYFVTFRLADSIPQAKLKELQDSMESWMLNNPNPSDQEYKTFIYERMNQVEKWLDNGYGSCLLKNRQFQQELESCLLRFNNERYILSSYAIVANHVHITARPLTNYALEDLDGAWKRYSAIAINKLQKNDGKLWQEESFDRIIRDTPHLRRVVGYIEKNIKHCDNHGIFWLRPDWHNWFYGKI